jgi:GTP diphosphokinase / guanosine-3',5'-bis(diphosphate) 3'-diphosphatase
VSHPPCPCAASGPGEDPIAQLLRVLAGTRPGADVALIGRAHAVAASCHEGQRRKSGDPYISHPLAVAVILAEIGADDQTVCAALLHDTVEGTSYAIAALDAEFGTEIAGLVAGVMALDAATDSAQPAEAGGADAMVAAASGDARILAIKLADRLHNMRTLQYLPQETQVHKSRQTLGVLVPVARILRLDAISAELENLASGTLRRYGQGAGTASGRVLAVMTLLLPAAVRPRWREEWLAELSVLPTRRERMTFAVRTVLGIARLAATLYRSAGDKAR